MNLKTLVLLVFMVALIGVSAAIVTHNINKKEQATALNTRSINALPNFNLLGLDGVQHKPNEWAGKILVVNFWATWCPPCRKEMPEFIRLQEKFTDKNVQFIGIAIDQIDPVRAFSKEIKVNYPILIADRQITEAASKMGNRLNALPFTVIFDSRGKLLESIMGGVDTAQLEQKLLDLQPKTPKA